MTLKEYIVSNVMYTTMGKPVVVRTSKMPTKVEAALRKHYGSTVSSYMSEWDYWEIGGKLGRELEKRYADTQDQMRRFHAQRDEV